MLVLARHENQKIIIDTPGGRIAIMVVEVRAESVRLGVTAPKEYTVHREEIQDVIDARAKA